MENTQLSLFGKTSLEHSLPTTGGDFQCVIEEMCRIADSGVTIPRPDSGRWLTAGAIMGGNYSIAWRVMDAQYWGVPQRRRRIALVADFGGQRAAKILFERKSVCWNPQTGEKARQSTAAGTAGSAGTAGEECLTPWDVQSRRIYPDFGTWPALYAGEGGGHGYVQQCVGKSSGSNQAPCICIAGNVVDRDVHQNGSGIKDDVCFTLNTVDRHAICMSTGQTNAEIQHEQCPTLNCNHEQPICVLPDVTGTLCASAAGLSRPAGQGNETNMCIVTAVDCRNLSETAEKSGTLQSKGQGGYSLNYIDPVRNGCIVRRLTPLECERLQGYPDGWTDIPGASDSARYKALGNSIALPQWDYVLRGISKYLPPRAKLGSLFDGIGGFPLTWERIQGAGTARWASEIEKFPMQVTAIKFREENNETAEKPAESNSRDAQ